MWGLHSSEMKRRTMQRQGHCWDWWHTTPPFGMVDAGCLGRPLAQLLVGLLSVYRQQNRDLHFQRWWMMIGRNSDKRTRRWGAKQLCRSYDCRCDERWADKPTSEPINQPTDQQTNGVLSFFCEVAYPPSWGLSRTLPSPWGERLGPKDLVSCLLFT